MKQSHGTLAAAAFCLFVGSTLTGTAAYAQMGMDFFKKPAIGDIFKPVVGRGAIYEVQRDPKKTTLEVTVVGQEPFGGKDAYWLEFGHSDQSGAMSYGKMLVTRDDFQFHRVIFQRPNQPPMEFPMDSSTHDQSRTTDELEKWHKVGTESITVPAGTSSAITGRKMMEREMFGPARKSPR